MYQGKKVVVVMPAYNAETTLVKTYNEVMETGIVDLVIVVDDYSRDQTVAVAKKLRKTRVIAHDRNLGYGANQKTCYKAALKEGADIVIMVHPDYQYTPKLIPSIAALISSGLYDCVIASRILGGKALEGQMPLWKYLSNRSLTFIENVILREKLSEYHSGYRAFSRSLLSKIPFEECSNDFVFDNQMIAQIMWAGYTIAEVTCPTKYLFPGASSIKFARAFKYAVGCIDTAVTFRLAEAGLGSSPLFPPALHGRHKNF